MPDQRITYFAYGSNMSPIQMTEERCPGSEPIGIGKLRGYRLVINRNGVATIVPEENGEVIGILWSITDQHERTLDGKEGVATGYYTRHWVIIEKQSGGEVKALVYIAAESEPGHPREGYLEKILYGAEHFGLPEEYIRELKSWKAT